MEGKISDHSTPSKPSLRIHDKFGHSTFNADTHLRFMHNYKTPESKLRRVKNPFEPFLQEKLHTHFFSPSVFANSKTKPDENFKWTIDEISHMTPADIDEHCSEQYSTPDRDSVESLAQSRIDKFFSMKEIVPSPHAILITSPLIKGIPQTPSPIKGTLVDNSAQTVLSLPPTLPAELELALRPYFNYSRDQQGGEALINNSLQRKLFEVDEKEGSPQSSPARSINLNLSPMKFSVYGPGDCVNYRADTPSTDDFLEECLLSPVICTGSSREKSRIRVRDSNHMSVDLSFSVPEVGDGSLQNNSLDFDSTKSSIKEALSDSTVNWDMEYKQIRLATDSNNTSAEEMDVSTSNTPRSKIFMSQRKKLSDSFREELQIDDEDNNEEIISVQVKEGSKNFTDTGYHTGYVASEDSTWNTSNFMASTPTKQKLFS